MKISPIRWSWVAIIVLIGFLVTACGTGRSLPGALPAGDGQEAQSLTQPSRTPFQPSAPDDTQLTPVDRAGSEPQSVLSTSPATELGRKAGVYLAEYLPDLIRQSLVLPAGLEQVSDPDAARIRIEVGNQNPISRWVFALVAPFPTLPEGVPAAELMAVWNGEPSYTFPDEPLLMDEDTHALFEAAWGPAAAESVKILPSGDLIDYAWENRPSWGIVPFEALEPRWKVLTVDGISPIRKDFNPDSYPLAITISINPAEETDDPQSTDELSFIADFPSTNRAAEKMTTLAMTGVTALVRCTAYMMETRGVMYPGLDIRELLREADITHVSNEIPFVEGCPFPSCFQEGLVFCSDPKYIELLLDIGTDIIELTGDHFADWGSQGMRDTLDLYQDQGLPYYGGGYNWEEGSQPVIIEHNGNRLAFIGCNGKGGGYATAGPENPGAVSCDFDTMHDEISRLRTEGYLPVATFQHFEYYTYLPQPRLLEDFRGMAEAGALIVSGSQAHQPHGMEISRESFVHYGLGNLFFDQYGYCPDLACDDAFIDRHVFYDGRYIATELIPIKFIDWARPRFMTAEERENFLEIIFAASGW